MKLNFTRNTVRFGAVFAAAFALTACQSGNSAQEALEQANLEKALYCANVLEVELDIEKARRECIGSTYIQHSSHVPDGKEGLLTYFEGRIKKFPEMRAEIKRAGADGDLVWMHVHFKKTPESRGNAVINIFRMEDGKLVEHWGVGQPVSKKSMHDNTMF